MNGALQLWLHQSEFARNGRKLPLNIFRTVFVLLFYQFLDYTLSPFIFLIILHPPLKARKVLSHFKVNHL